MNKKSICALLVSSIYVFISACASKPELPPVEALTAGVLRFTKSDLKQINGDGFEENEKKWMLKNGSQVDCRNKVCEITFRIRRPARSSAPAPQNRITLNQAEIGHLFSVMEASKGAPGRRLTQKDQIGFLSCTPDDCALAYDFAAAAVFSSVTSAEPGPLQLLAQSALQQMAQKPAEEAAKIQEAPKAEETPTTAEAPKTEEVPPHVD